MEEKETGSQESKRKILIVEGAGSTRALLTEVFKAQGFTDVQAVGSLKDAIGILEVEPVFWLITSIYPDQEDNLLQVLKLSCMVPALRDLRVSAFVEKNEMPILAEAFELGLLSYHAKPFTKDSLQGELENTVADFDKMQWSSLPIASQYLRKYLNTSARFEELVTFERQLLKLLPGDLQQLLNLVSPLAQTSRADEAKQILAQTVKLDSTLQKQVNALASQFFPDQNIDDIESTVNILGIKTAVIVDNDSSVQRELKKVFEEMGVDHINIFDDGASALDYLKDNPGPDVIVHEWKIPKVTGPLFLQRARENGGKHSPFIACSSLIEKTDVPFLKEMGIAHVLKKPIQRNDLIKGLAWTIQQDRRPTDKGALERKIRDRLGEKDFAEAEKYIAVYLAEPAISIGSKQLMRAELCYAQSQYEKAREFAVDAMKQGGESILVLNLLGKIMLQLRVLETALKCFERAQQLAPANIERLCQIAEIQAELGDEEASEATLNKVDDLDKGGDKGDESRAKIAISHGDSSSAKKIMGQLDSIANVLAYMNNRAIAMARCGMVAEGITQYLATIDAIPENQVDYKSIVLYNLALAYIRDQKINNAKEALTDPVHDLTDRMKARITKLLARIKNAESKGEILQMPSLQAAVETVPAEGEASKEGGSSESKDMQTISTDSASSDLVLMAIENRAGDRGCYMIFQSSVKSPEVAKMLGGSIFFKTRKSVQKGPSL